MLGSRTGQNQHHEHTLRLTQLNIQTHSHTRSNPLRCDATVRSKRAAPLYDPRRAELIREGINISDPDSGSTTGIPLL